MTNSYRFWRLQIFTDQRGSLCPIEWSALPFKSKRAYFLFGTEKKRGGHAHKKEKEVFICIKGSFRAKIHTGRRAKTFHMNKPGQALYTAHLVWHEFDNFTRDAILLAISSTPYRGQKGYIMDFDEFKNLCKKRKS